MAMANCKTTLSSISLSMPHASSASSVAAMADPALHSLRPKHLQLPVVAGCSVSTASDRSRHISRSRHFSSGATSLVSWRRSVVVVTRGSATSLAYFPSEANTHRDRSRSMTSPAASSSFEPLSPSWSWMESSGDKWLHLNRTRGGERRARHLDHRHARVGARGIRIGFGETDNKCWYGVPAHRIRRRSMRTRVFRCGVDFPEASKCKPAELAPAGSERWAFTPTSREVGVGRRGSESVTTRISPSQAAAVAEMDSNNGAAEGVEALTATTIKRGSLAAALAWVDAYVRFTRPHTIIGTTISIISVSSMALQSMADINTRSVLGLIQALVAACLMNVAIVGMNEITDIEIDQVNKPYLPLASGEWTPEFATGLVIAHAIASLAVGVAVGSTPLLWTLLLSLALGIGYSVDVPFLRWKRYPFIAAGCILSVRAVLVQLGFFFHMRQFALGLDSVVTKNVATGLSIMCIYSIIIALFKDIPDVEGDRRYGIRSFSVVMGQRKIFWFCVSMLLAANATMIGVGLMSNVLWSKVITVSSHIVLGSIMWREAKRQSFTKRGLTDFYMFVWKLFYAEYLLLPFVR